MPISRPRRAVRHLAGPGGVIAGALVAVLTGCAGGPSPTPTPSPDDAVAPIFASDEEALAAAEAAYGAFLEVSTTITNEGGSEPERLEDVASGAALEEERTAAQRFQKEGLRTVGTVGFRVYDLQSVVSQPSGQAEIIVYVCDDLRDLDLLDATGSSMIVEGRVVDVPYTVVVRATDADTLRVDEKELWTRDNFCLV